MPAVVCFAIGYLAGIGAGLFVAAAPWVLAPAAAVGALACWRRVPSAAIVATALAAGVLWGAAERARHPACAAALPAPCRDAAPDSATLRVRLQRSAERRLRVLFGERRAGVAAALTIDPGAKLPFDQRDAFKRAGLAHLLSISGFHVAILAGALILVLRILRAPPTTARIAGTLIVAAYVWLLGAPAPAVRSAALLAVWTWARLRQRPTGAVAAIATTAIAVVTIRPFALVEPGPWLSFSGAWGCVAAAYWWRRAAQRVPALAHGRLARLVGQPAAISTGAVLATTPITILAFGTGTPAAIVANLAAVPLASFVVPTIALALLLASAGLGGAAQVAAAAGSLALDWLGAVAAWAGGLPFAQLSFERRVPAALAAAAIALILLRRAVSPRRPLRSLFAARLACGALLIACVVAWLPYAPAPAEGDGRLTLFFLPVGEGDATLIRTPHGAWITIDGGPWKPGDDAGAKVVVPFLRRQGARRLALVAFSHPDADHLGGVPALLRAFPADVALEPGMADGRSLYRHYLARVTRRSGRWHAGRAGEAFTIDGVSFRIWHPDSAWLQRRLPPNENSLVLTVEYGAFRALFPGDAGLPMEAERAAAIGPVTLLKVSHHGSHTATSDAWLAALAPSICVISVGPNHYGHPEPGTLAALRAAGCRTVRTDVDGLITVFTDGDSTRVELANQKPTSGV